MPYMPPIVTSLARPTPGRTRPAARRLGHLLAVVAMVLLGVSAMAMPASAHGTDTSKEGYIKIQQALGQLAHDGGHVGMDLALVNVDDALTGEDHDGVDVAQVQQAKQALQAEQVDQARALLQDSIKQALAELPAATGEMTGTKEVLTPLSGRAALTGRDWAFLGVSALLLLGGLVLAIRYRPKDSVGDLRRLLVGPPAQKEG